MSTEPIIAERLDEIVWWIREREKIRKAKESGAPKPWTSDPFLQGYRWCNVSRAMDAISRTLLTKWYQDGPFAEQLVAATLGRLINWTDTLLEASGGKPFSLTLLPTMRAALHARAARSQKIFTGAYVVPGVPGRNKIDSTMDLVERVAAQADALRADTLRGTWTALTSLDGLGSFLAGQIGADIALLSSGAAWPDRLTFAPVGPGSARGMNRLRGRPKTKPLSQEKFDLELQEYAEALALRVPEVVQELRLNYQDIQGTLCEADKNWRLRAGEGSVRARYDGAPPVPPAPPGPQISMDLGNP